MLYDTIKTWFDRRPWLLGVLLVALTVVVYLPVRHAGFIWDDDDYLTSNSTLRSADGLRRIWGDVGATPQYYPLVFTAFWAEYHLWHLQPLGYHLINVLLHAANALLLWLVLRRLAVPGAWAAAALFAVHPVGVESVAWITEHKNVLSTALYLLAMLAYLRFRPLTGADGEGRPDWRFYPLVILLFAGALLSKTVSCSLPAVILLVTWWKRGRVGKQDVLALLPLFLMGGALGLMTAWLEKHHVGATGAEWAMPLMDRCLVAGRALWFYAGKLVWPQSLAFIYSRWPVDPGIWWQHVFPWAAVAVLAGLWMLRHRAGTGPLVAGLCFAGTLVPALGFFDVYPFRYSFVADHFQYLASMSFLALVAAVGARIGDRAGQSGRHAGATALAIVLVVLGTLTWKQTGIYRDAESLWRDTLAKNPGAWAAHNNLGLALENAGQLPEAIEHYQQALRIKPDHVGAHNNLGNAWLKTGQLAQAMDQFQQALRIRPDDADAHANLGNALTQAGREPEAIRQYEAALRTNPRHFEAHYNLGLALEAAGQLPDAIRHYELALRARPDQFEAQTNLANALTRTGRLPEAVAHYDQAVQIQPGSAEARYNLALALSEAGRLAEAIRQYEAALRIKPDYAGAHNNLGNALVQAGRLEDAIGHYERALQIEPGRANTHFNLANALAQVGRVKDAIGHYQEAIRLRPDFTEAKTSLARLAATP